MHSHHRKRIGKCFRYFVLLLLLLLLQLIDLKIAELLFDASQQINNAINLIDLSICFTFPLAFFDALE